MMGRCAVMSPAGEKPTVVDQLFFGLRRGLTKCQGGGGTRRSHGLGSASINKKFTAQSRPSDEKRIEHFRAVFQRRQGPKHFGTQANRDFDHRPFLRPRRGLYVPPFDDRKLNPPTSPTSS